MAALIDIVKKGSTDRSVTLRIIDSGDGTPETGVVFNTSGIDLWYRREGGLKVSITEADLATPALDDAHGDGGFLHIGDGEYRLDLPDAALLTGANYVDVGGTVTGMIVIGGRVRLTDFDIETATQPANVTQLGGVTQSLTDLKHFADSGYDPATSKIEGVKTADALTANSDKTGYALTSAYDAAKTAAQAGDQMDLVNAPNATAVTAIQNGLSTLDAAGIRTAIGMASANLDTQIGDLPTNAELTSALAALNDLDAAGVRAALGMASADLDTQLDAILAVATLIRKLRTGNLVDKSGGGAGEYSVLDDDDATPIADVTLAETEPYQQVTVL